LPQADISKAAETARKFTRHGMVLKQVANFYNEISTQMVPCQKSMMLEDALRFEQVLKSPRDGLGNPITWSNVQALQVLPDTS
jgi:dynein heavy chain 2